MFEDLPSEDMPWASCARDAGFEERGAELLEQLEKALLAEARANPESCRLGVSKAVSLIVDTAEVGSRAQKLPMRRAENTRVPFEADLGKALKKLENSLLLHVREGAGSDKTIRKALVRTHKTIHGTQTQNHDPVPTANKHAVKKREHVRPSSAPFVRPRIPYNEQDLHARQRAYDDARRGRVRVTTSASGFKPMLREQFDAGKACNHCFKPVRVPRDENGRLQPRPVSNRLSRISMPSFLGKPFVSLRTFAIPPSHFTALQHVALKYVTSGCMRVMQLLI
jgi:hypothetical protein